MTPTKPSLPAVARQKPPGLVFEKATGDGDADVSTEAAPVARHRKPSDNNVQTASFNTSTGSGGHASFETAKQPGRAQPQVNVQYEWTVLQLRPKVAQTVQQRVSYEFTWIHTTCDYI